MFEPYSNVVDRFVGKPGVSIHRESEARVLEIQRQGVTVRITVADAVLEWFIDIADTEIHEWSDYTGYDSTSHELLVEGMHAAVCEFVEKGLSRELRLSNGKRDLEWRVNMQWE